MENTEIENLSLEQLLELYDETILMGCGLKCNDGYYNGSFTGYDCNEYVCRRACSNRGGTRWDSDRRCRYV